MIKLAICDDDVSFSNNIKGYIDDIKNANIDIEVEVYLFSSGLNMLNCIENGLRFDVMFIDIQMPEIDGVKLASKIRDIYDPMIVFISVSNNYFVDIFELKPFGFLSKPIKRFEFERVFFVIHKNIVASNEFYTFKFQRCNLRVKIKDIIYVRSFKRQVIIKCIDKEYMFYGKLSDIYETLKDFDFMFIHKSYLINYKHIYQITYDYVVMGNGERFDISERKKKYIRKLYMHIGEKDEFKFKKCSF